MSTHFHPSEETLFRHAAGQLSEGHALITRTHLEFCSQCSAQVGAFEAIGGALLEEIAPVSLAPDSFARTLERIGEMAPPLMPIGKANAKFLADLPNGFTLPSTLARYDLGRWRPLAPGVRFSSFQLNAETRGMFLRARAGAALPTHTHRGMEYTIVLAGSFDDELNHMAPGDMTEYGDTITHRPIVSQEGECICLFVFEGQLKVQSFLGRLLQPLMGI